MGGKCELVRRGIYKIDGSPMTLRVDVQPALYTWASERSRLDTEYLATKFPNLEAWKSGRAQPTLKQLETFASTTHTPIGFLFLQEPPIERIPIPDFRTISNSEVGRPSADLLDTIYICQQRQEWYRDYAAANGEDRASIVGAATISGDAIVTAANMRRTFEFDVGERGNSWSEAVHLLSESAEQLGVLVMVSGIVGSDTHRKLDPQEFRGFALIDERAPVVFVNGADSKAAQIFTIVHELAHILLGVSGLSNPDLYLGSDVDIEHWCNQVAAEMLVPDARLRVSYRQTDDLATELDRLAAEYRVSTLVVLRRIHDVGLMSRMQYHDAYASEHDRVMAFFAARSESGGNFYNTTPVRVSKRFARAIIANTLEGQTLYREAFRMLGFQKQATFDHLSHTLGST